jgi:hypothetical protein
MRSRNRRSVDETGARRTKTVRYHGAFFFLHPITNRSRAAALACGGELRWPCGYHHTGATHRGGALIDATLHDCCFLRPAQAGVAAWLALVLWCPLAFAQDNARSPNPSEDKPSRPISYGVEIAFGSGHADRGFVISDRPVVQPETWVSGSFGEFSLWSNFTLAETSDSARPEILEMELTREHKWRSLTIAPAVSLVFYQDPLSHDRSRTIEGWLYLSCDVGPLRLFTNHSVNVQTNGSGYYGEAGIESERYVSHSVEVGGSFGTGWASAAFNKDYADIARSALDHVAVEGWLTAHLGPHLYIGPHVEFSTIVDHRVRAGLERPTYFLVGLVTGGEF